MSASSSSPRPAWTSTTRAAGHYGYWEEDTKSLAEAVTRLNEKLVEVGRVTGADRVLDAGCGLGAAPSSWRAALAAASTESRSARRRSRGAGRTPGVAASRTSCASSAATTSPPGSTTRPSTSCGRWRACATPSTSATSCGEAYRLLRPGGRLPLADFFSVNLDGRPRRDRRLMEKWTRSWAIREYAVTEEFERQMAEAGFPDVVVRDVTRSVDRSVRRLFFYYYPGLVYTYLQQVHEAGIVHKDVNPGNILVNLEEGTVDLIDFGISSRVELQAQHLGNPARLEGTLAYI